MNSTDNVIGLLLAVVIAGYLVYALVFPERL
jgi:K+-transporting ATPase KdpF subunit